MRRWACVLLASSIALDAGASATNPRGPHPVPTLPWIVTQLIPSPQVAFGDGARFGVRWQVTPILFSFRMHRKLSPWRFFVVEPLTRTSGSLEAFVVPEVVDLGPRAQDLFVFRSGMRVTVPILERGEYLSLSFASGTWVHDGDVGAFFEWGAYSLFGIVGFQFSLSPRLRGAETMLSLRIRYF